MQNRVNARLQLKKRPVCVLLYYQHKKCFPLSRKFTSLTPDPLSGSASTLKCYRLVFNALGTRTRNFCPLPVRPPSPTFSFGWVPQGRRTTPIQKRANSFHISNAQCSVRVGWRSERNVETSIYLPDRIDLEEILASTVEQLLTLAHPIHDVAPAPTFPRSTQWPRELESVGPTPNLVTIGQFSWARENHWARARASRVQGGDRHDNAMGWPGVWRFEIVKGMSVSSKELSHWASSPK